MKNQAETTPGKPAPNRRDNIARKAYEIWLTEGCPSGRAAEHWRKAEEMLAKDSVNQTTGGTNPPSSARPVVLDSKAVLAASSRGPSHARA